MRILQCSACLRIWRLTIKRYIKRTNCHEPATHFIFRRGAAEIHTGLMMPLMSARMPKGRLGDLMSRKVVSQSCRAPSSHVQVHAEHELARWTASQMVTCEGTLG